MIINVTDRIKKEEIAKEILSDLPEWFGVEEYTKEYIENSVNMPFFACLHEGKEVGFLSLKETSDSTIEIYCMGILKKCQNLGYGRSLINEALNYARYNRYKLIQVKTVEQGRYEEYDKTNLFYQKMGFLKLEVFKNLWDEWNPCQVLVKVVE
ncbi:GNAT family N-acetyltransferase [Acholeplasma sp. OttesenSCG-928-E16]|nr:GNAT family N-acetyltransferase [Acholeplasma sp. OttesenSCG-928-E16]